MATDMSFVDGATVIPADWLNNVNDVINGGIGTGTVTTVSVASSNGFAGTVATATSTPIITLTTSITGLLKGNGTAISAASAGTDYSTPSSTDTLTNKTFDTAGTGNSFSINGVAATANTGTGAVARAVSPSFTTPTLGVATCTSINSMTITTSTGTFTLTNGKTLAVTNSITLAGTDGTTLTLPTETASIGYLNVPQVSKSAAYTLELTDAGKHIYHPSADTTARIWTIDSNANVPYPIGTTLTFVNDTSGGVITISITSDTLVLAGAGTTGSRTLAANGVATAIKVTSTRWIISGTGLT